ncbi:40S ribosomal protein s7 [Pseudoloma neurophilia]|uniref:40S ribosomal protein s7 n=1 Tax=Pseudoloma neurophilia TaxID=146866 RepID=A0A0R0LST5_9MICR|nr:40S ribosomal protein s7 [Pseudoloma neurophilia]
MSQTKAEESVSNLVNELFGSQMNKTVKEQIDQIKIQVVQEEDENAQPAMIILMPIKILDFVHANFTVFKKKLDKIFHNHYFFFIRTPQINFLSKTINENTQEKWIFDLCYPAELQNRVTEIKNGGTIKIEKAMLERRCDFLPEDFTRMENAYKTLTKKTIIYSLRHY